MDFDFKIVTWERVKVPKEYEAEVLKGIEDGTIACASDIWNVCDDAEIGSVDCYANQMSVEENGGQATIEVQDNGEVIFQNNE